MCRGTSTQLPLDRDVMLNGYHSSLPGERRLYESAGGRESSRVLLHKISVVPVAR